MSDNKENYIGRKVVGGGTVVGQLTAKAYCYASATLGNIEEFIQQRKDVWGEDWFKSDILYVHFPTGVKPGTIDEFRNQNPYIKEECMEEQYNKQVKPVYLLAIPLTRVGFEE